MLWRLNNNFHCLNTLTKQNLGILKTTSFWKYRKTKLKTNESYEIKNQLIRNYKILLNWILEKIKNIVYHLAFVLFLSYEYLYINFIFIFKWHHIVHCPLLSWLEWKIEKRLCTLGFVPIPKRPNSQPIKFHFWL